jgi:hypothetical protein
VTSQEVAAAPASVPTIAASPTPERPAQAVVPPTAAPVSSVPAVTVPKVEPTAVVVAPTPVVVVPAPERSPVVDEPAPRSQPQQGGVWTGGGPATGAPWVSVPLRPVTTDAGTTPTAASPEGYRTDAPLTAGWPDTSLPPMPSQIRLPPMPVVVQGGGARVVQPSAQRPWGEVIDIELSMDWPEQVLPPMPRQVVPDLIVAPQAQEEVAEIEQLPQVPAIDVDDNGSIEGGWPEIPVLWLLSLAFAVAAAATQRRGRLVLTWIGKRGLALLLFILGLN